MRKNLRRRTTMAALAGVVAILGVGSAGVAVAAQEPEQSSVARQTHAEAVAAGTPCSVSARACVDLESQQAWLLRDGAVIYGPVPVASGGAGQETPLGHSFRVYRKDAEHKSAEFNGAPMPWSVFFADGGVAFHGGDRNRSSAGCVKLDPEPAQRFFGDLAAGDQVQVVNASAEKAGRGAA